MVLIDKNQSWKAPEGYRFASLAVEGAFLIAHYTQDVFNAETAIFERINYVDVYLNDQGREVARTERIEEIPEVQVEHGSTESKKQLSWREWVMRILMGA